MELTYTEQNGLLIPDLVLDDQPSGSLGKYGRMRKRYLEQKHDGTFSALVLSSQLTEHLMEVDQAARDQMASLIPQLAAAEGVTESLKARAPPGLGPVHELHPRPSGGDGQARFDLQLIAFTKQQPAIRQVAVRF